MTPVHCYVWYCDRGHLHASAHYDGCAPISSFVKAYEPCRDDHGHFAPCPGGPQQYQPHPRQGGQGQGGTQGQPRVGTGIPGKPAGKPQAQAQQAKVDRMAQARSLIEQIKAKPELAKDRAHMVNVANHLASLTVRELREVNKDYGLKAQHKDKEEFQQRVREKLEAFYKGQAGTTAQKPAEKPKEEKPKNVPKQPKETARERRDKAHLAAHDLIQRAKADPALARDPKHLDDLKGNLKNLTNQQIKDLAGLHGLSAKGKTKDALVEKLSAELKETKAPEKTQVTPPPPPPAKTEIVSAPAPQPSAKPPDATSQGPGQGALTSADSYTPPAVEGDRGKNVESLVKGAISDQQQLKGNNLNAAFTVNVEGMGKAVWKPAGGETPAGKKNIPVGTYHVREAAAYHAAEAMGLGDLVPPTVIRTRDDQPGEKDSYKVGSLQKFVENAKIAGDAFDQKQGSQFDGPKDHARAAAFDYATLNTDRHLNNWLMGPGDKIQLIDHGLSFPEDKKGNSGQSQLLAEAIRRDMPIPAEAKTWVGDKAKAIEKSMRDAGLSEKATSLAMGRVARMADPKIKTFGELHEGGRGLDLHLAGEVLPGHETFLEGKHK